MRARAKLSSKGQVTIPREIRRRLGLEQGDEVDFVVEDDVSILRPARGSANPFEAYAGALGTVENAAEVNDWLRTYATRSEGAERRRHQRRLRALVEGAHRPPRGGVARPGT